jgi:hypothetical protein
MTSTDATAAGDGMPRYALPPDDALSEIRRLSGLAVGGEWDARMAKRILDSYGKDPEAEFEFIAACVNYARAALAAEDAVLADDGDQEDAGAAADDGPGDAGTPGDTLWPWPAMTAAEMADWHAARDAERIARARLPITDAHRAFEFLDDHPVRGWMDSSFISALTFDYVRVDPETDAIEDAPDRNTAIRVWLETGPGQTGPVGDEPGGATWHDPGLDCGEPDFETALMRLAANVRARYGPPLADGLADAVPSDVEPAWGVSDQFVR